MRFLLVDRIGDYEAGRKIQGRKCASMAEDYFEWHFPEKPIVPGMLILEACAQLAGWLEAVTSDFESWFLLDRVSSARYYDFAVPGDVIEISLERVDDAGEGDGVDDGRRAYAAVTTVGEARGAALEFEGVVVPLESLEARAAVRRTWAVLRGEG